MDTNSTIGHLVVLCANVHTFNCESDKENYIFTSLPLSSVDNQKVLSYE